MPLDLARIRAICLDVDGTLRDTDDQIVQRLADWLRPLRIVFRNRDVLPFCRRLVMKMETPGTFLYRIPDVIGLDAWLAKLDEAAHRYTHENAPPGWLNPVPGVIEALRQLHRLFPLAIVSARNERNTLAFLKQHDILSLFQCIATWQTCQHTKPYPDPVLWAARQMGVPPQSCLMIGDTSVDIQSGKAAGAQTLGVLSGFGEEDELRQAGADLILPSVAWFVKMLSE